MLLLACTQNLTICLIGREETGGDEVEEKRGGGGRWLTAFVFLCLVDQRRKER